MYACRFLDAAELDDAGLKGPLRTLREATLFTAYNAVMGVETLRKGAGATPGTRDTPQELTDVDVQVGCGIQQQLLEFSSRIFAAHANPVF